VIVPANFGEFFYLFWAFDRRDFQRSRAIKRSGLCFWTAPVEPTLGFKIVGATGAYKVRLLGFLAFLLNAPVL